MLNGKKSEDSGVAQAAKTIEKFLGKIIKWRPVLGTLRLGLQRSWGVAVDKEF
jgi:hypothetical protein